MSLIKFNPLAPASLAPTSFKRASRVRSSHALAYIKLAAFALALTLTMAVSAALLSGCSSPLSFNKEECITLTLPVWPPDDSGYPPLLRWKICVTNENGTREFSEPTASAEIKLNVTKDDFCSIIVQPVIQNVANADSNDASNETAEKSAASGVAKVPDNFFYPAGAVYPHDFINRAGSAFLTTDASWQKGTYALIAQKVLTSASYYPNRQSALCFNWQKLRDELIKKDNSSFEKYDSLKTKKCTLSFNCDIDSTVEKLLNADQKFSISYFDTSALTESQTKKLNLAETDIFLSQYIPLNSFTKEKGCIIVQTKPSDYKTAFLLNGSQVFIVNKKLVTE